MKLVALLFLIFCAIHISEAIAQSKFFPTRPAHVPPIHYLTGIITDYGIGNDTAGLTVRNASGKLLHFYLASPSRINNKAYNPYKCTDRGCGSTLEFGHTKVRVEYWWQRAPSGEVVKISNSIVTLR